MNVRVCVEFNMKKYEKIKQKLNDLEEIHFTPEEYNLVFEMVIKYHEFSTKVLYHLKNIFRPC